MLCGFKKLHNRMRCLEAKLVPQFLFHCFQTGVPDQEKKSVMEAMILSGDDWSVRGIKFQCQNVMSWRKSNSMN